MPDWIEADRLHVPPTRAAATAAPPRRPHPGWLAVSLCCLLAGAAMSTRALHGIDLWLMRGLNHLTGRVPLADHMIHDLTKDTLSTVLMLSLLCTAWSARPLRASRALLVATTFASCACIVLCFVLQAVLPDHLRPLHDPRLAFHPPPSIDPAVFSPGMAFPAEHAALLFALALGITLVWPRLGAAALVLAALTSLARVYLGFVYPSDTIAGAGIGLLLVWSSCTAAPRRLAGRIAGWAELQPGPFAGAAFFICFGIGRLFEDERYIAHGLARALLHHH